MGLSTKITGYDRFVDKFNKKKKSEDNLQPKSHFGNKPATKSGSAK
jgi:hypothetical protein